MEGWSYRFLMMRMRLVVLLVVFSLALAPAGMACVQAEAAAGASATAGNCCCGPMAEACASARVANVPHGCPCASRDEAPTVPSVPPAPAGERPAASSSASFDHALVSVDLAPIADGAEPRGQGGAGDGALSRGSETSLCILDCVFRL